jgi:hypothetical protein
MPSQRRTLRPYRPTPGSAPWELARDAAEAIRAVNHRTLDRDGYGEPADLDATLVELVTLADRLPQAITQATTWLDHQHAEGRLGHDRHVPPEQLTAVVQAAVDDLAAAGQAAGVLARALDRARQLTAHLTVADPGADPHAEPHADHGADPRTQP